MKKLLLVSISVLLLVGFFSMPIAAVAAEKRGPASASLSTDKDAILRAVTKNCTPDWCKPTNLVIIEGRYATVDLICKRRDCESDTAYLMKVGEKWIIKDQGTGLAPDDLIEYGFPRRVVKKIFRE